MTNRSVLCIFLLLWMETMVNGEATNNIFLKDIISTFRLTSPTVVYNSDEEAPDICYTNQRVLCLHPGLPSWYPEDVTKKMANKSEVENKMANDRNCLTVAGPSAGMNCIFPFKYEGVTHNACTKHGIEDTEYDPWCSTKVDNNGDHMEGGGYWGDCSEECPNETDCLTVAGPSPGMKCIFPFIFEGFSFSGCPFDPLRSGNSWCSTKVDNLGNHIIGEGHWGDCNEECPHIISTSMALGNSFADYIVMLHHRRKQDSLIFAGTKISKGMLEDLHTLEQDIFRSDCPIFLPMEYSNVMTLRLDSNIVFYGDQEDGSYSLVDKFAVNGEPDFFVNMGTWDNNNGVKLTEKTYRWDRRTDLLGAKFINALYENKVGSSAYFVYDNNGTIIGSGGHYQDQLFYITDRLNLSVKNTYLFMDDDGWVDCYKLLDEHETDICSGGYVYDGLGRDKHIVTKRPTAHTLIAGVLKENAPDAWVYIYVFGWQQWLVISFSLIVISFVMQLSEVLYSGNNHQRPPISVTFSTTYLFVLQQGNHPETRLLAKRFISLTASMVTLLVFIYYSNDITAKMTAGYPPHPVRTFQDVLDHGYRVIVVGNLQLHLLRSAKKDSAKFKVYELSLEKEDKMIDKYYEKIDSGEPEEAKKFLPSWFSYTQENFDLAAEQIIEDKNTLWYCHKECADEEIGKGNVVDLKMEDTHYTYGGWALKLDSEYVSVLSHYVMKGYESGIFHRLHLNYSTRTPIKIGMTEPGSLGINNVMFPFSLLGIFMIISMLIAFVEKLAKICKKIQVRDIPVDPVGNESPSEPHAPAKDKSEAGREHNIASFPPPDKNAKIEVEEVNY